VLELLVRLFDASRFITEIVLNRPQLIEEVARGQGLGDSLGVGEYLKGLNEAHEDLSWADWVRAYRRAQTLRIALRDLLGFANLTEVQAEYSALAEACLVFVQRQLGAEDELTVIAMGKFGGRELTYGADLDVVFIGENPKLAAEVIRTMTAPTDQGVIFRMDTRLRPEGDAGLLATPLAGYEAYFASPRAQMWEAQALTKARPVSGPQQAEALAVAQQAWREFGKRADVFAQTASMHERIVRERDGEDQLNFKTGRGGLMQVEFFAQAHQMRAAVWEQNTVLALEALGAQGIIPLENAERLREAYLFLRRVESILRRQEESSVSKLPVDEDGQVQLARRCGFGSRERLLRACDRAREEISVLAELTAP
jgi:glutamate-ammonia-ligase adenylyltransferase